MINGNEHKTELRKAREALHVSQEYVARRTTSIKLRTYMRAEAGVKSVRHATATEILEALNLIREEKQMPPLSLEDLGLKLY